jgi:hypothetical protein
MERLCVQRDCEGGEGERQGAERVVGFHGIFLGCVIG